MNTPRFLPPIFFLASLLWGLRLGAALSPFRFDAENTDIPHPMITLANDQRTILIVTVDQLQAPYPEVRSIWEAIYAPAYLSITWVPLYTAEAGSTSAQSRDLLGAFRLTTDKHLDPAFIHYLNQRNFEWSGYLILDETAGQQFFEAFGLDYAAASTTTGSISLIQSFCRATEHIETLPNLLGLYQSLSGHVVTDIRPVEAFSEWQVLLRHGGEQFCDFPTLAQQQTP